MTSGADFITTASFYQYLHIGERVIFSICIIMIQIKNRAVYLWLCSNAVAILGNIYTLQYYGADAQFTDLVDGSLIILSSALQALSLSDRGLTRKSNRIPSIFLIIGLILGVSIFAFYGSYFRVLAVAAASIFIALSGIFYLSHNKTWLGMTSLKCFYALLCLVIVALIFTLSNAYPIGSRTKFLPTDSAIPYRTIILVMLIFCLQMTFIRLIIERQARESIFKSRKSLRIQQASNQAKANEKSSAALAEERYHLIKMLTHEVRQPLNTAQATLDTVSRQLHQGRADSEYIQQTVMNAQTTLSSIVLSISNSILGATLITHGRPSQLQSIDLCDVSQLALLDIEPLQRSRIHQKFEQPVIYTDADPIILRLAIRNLLENALKYSPSGTPILFELVTDEEKLALVIRVTNTIKDQSTLNADIFERNKRGVDSLYEGSGLGLYIVRAVAKLHNGDVSYYFLSDHQVAFELTITT